MPDWHVVLGVFSGLLSAGATVPYLRDMLNGNTRPNLVSWSLWVLLQGIVVAAQFESGASWSIILPLSGMLTCAAVVVLGLCGYGYRKYSYFDGVCLALAIFAIILWKGMSDPMIAVMLSIAADFLATMPTIRKALKDPLSESSSPFAIYGIAALFSIFSSIHFYFLNTIWPVYILFVNGLVILCIFIGKRMRQSDLVKK